MADFNNGLTVSGGLVVDGVTVSSSTVGLTVAQLTAAGYAKSTDITKTQAGLSEADNTADVNKPVSTALTLYTQKEKEYISGLNKVMHVGAVVDSCIDYPYLHSDAGAWIDRCQDKSWYNETLGGLYWLNTRCPDEATARAVIQSLNKPNLVSTDKSAWNNYAGATLSNANGNLIVTQGTADFGQAYKNVNVETGKTYVFTLNVIAGTASNFVVQIGGVTKTASARAHAFVYTAIGSSVQIVLAHNNANPIGSTVMFSDINLAKVDPTVDTVGYVYQTTATGSKFYSTNRNLLAYTEDFTNSWWPKASATMSLNAGIAPDGNSTADALMETTANVFDHYMYTINIGTLTGVITFSLYVKANGRSIVQLAGVDSGSAFRPIYDLTAVTVSSIAGVTTFIQPVGNGWYRCGWTKTCVSLTQITCILQASATYQSYVGDVTKGVYVWGAQLEYSSYANNYTPVLGAAVGSQTEVFRGTKREYPRAGVLWIAETSRIIGYDIGTGSMWYVSKIGYLLSIVAGQGQVFFLVEGQV